MEAARRHLLSHQSYQFVYTYGINWLSVGAEEEVGDSLVNVKSWKDNPSAAPHCASGPISSLRQAYLYFFARHSALASLTPKYFLIPLLFPFLLYGADSSYFLLISNSIEFTLYGNYNQTVHSKICFLFFLLRSSVDTKPITFYSAYKMKRVLWSNPNGIRRNPRLQILN